MKPRPPSIDLCNRTAPKRSRSVPSGKRKRFHVLAKWVACAGRSSNESMRCLRRVARSADRKARTSLTRGMHPVMSEINKWDIKFDNGTFIQTLSSHYTSAAGGQQALTLWDELWGYQTEKTQRLWEEMTLIPTEKLGLRVVVTYAGFEGESHLLWELYRSTVLEGIRLKDSFPDLPCYTNRLGTMFVYWDHEPRMPWQSADYYEGYSSSALSRLTWPCGCSNIDCQAQRKARSAAVR